MFRQQLKCTCDCHDNTRLEREAANSYTSRSAETRAILDERIASLEANLLSLKKMRNRHLPISWLPTETLTQILLDLVRPAGRYKPQSWQTHVELTRVCTHWRSIAMQCPRFWSCVPLITSKGLAKHVEKMLARSMDYPFSIRKDIEEEKEEDTDSDHASESSLDDSHPDRALSGAGGDDNPSALQRTLYLQAQAHRLQKLYLIVDPNSKHLQKYEYLIAQDSPSLRSLDVTLNRLPHPDSTRSLFSPEAVLGSHRMPSLRTLRLSGFFMRTADWEILSCSAFHTQKLTTLKLGHFVINSMPGQYFAAPPHELLLKILRASPRLHTLELSNCIGGSTSDFSESSSNSVSDKVHLPRLASLSLDKTPSLAAVVRFLSDLVFPSSTEIKLDSLRMDNPPPGSSAPQFQSELIRRLFLSCGLGGSGRSRRAGPRQHKAVRLFVYSDLFTRLRLSSPSRRPSASEGRPYPGDGLISMTLGGPKRSKMVLKHLPPGISVLDVVYSIVGWVQDPRTSDSPDLADREDWRNFFAKQSSIQVLRIEGLDMRKVLDALGPRPPPSVPSNADIGQDPNIFATQTVSSPVDETLLPRLRSLSFAAGVLVDRGDGASPTLLPTSSNYDSLKAMLIMRRQQGLPISSICLTPSSELTPAQHEMKEEICAINGQGTVVWGS